MDTTWTPKLGDRVVYNRVKLVRGLKMPPLKGTVVAFYKSGHIGVKIDRDCVKACKVVSLEPLKE